MRLGVNLQSLSDTFASFQRLHRNDPSTATLECSADNKEKKDGAENPGYNGVLLPFSREDIWEGGEYV